MGKINKNSSFKANNQRRKNKILDIAEFSESEKQFIIQECSQKKSPAVVQSLFTKKFPLSPTPTHKLIYKLATVSLTRHVGLSKSAETHPQADGRGQKAADKISTPVKDSSNAYKITNIQSRVNFKQSKKKTKYLKVLNNRLSKLFDFKTNSANTSVVDSPKNNGKNVLSGSPRLDHSLKENCNVDNLNYSGVGVFNRKKKKWQNLDIGRHSNTFIETISLDSPQPKLNKDAPIVCEIDLTASPNLNNNTVCTKSDGSNKYVSSTPFINFKRRSYANVASMSNMEGLSPIQKKVDNGDSSKKCALATCDDSISFVTVDQSVNSELLRNDFVTVINLDNDEKCTSQLSENTSLNNITVMTKENADKLPVQSIDLTEDHVALNVRRDVPNTKACRNQLIYDLTLDQNDSITLNHSLSTLEKKRTCLINALADTVKDSSERLMKKSRINRNGSNIYFPGNHRGVERSGLRMVVIDGSNVALSHSHGKCFSVEGLKICIDYFLLRGHEVKTFVPQFRNKKWKSSNPRLLDQLEQAGHVVYTPSREIRGRCIASYDDRYIVQCAVEFQGVIVSRDNYRDLLLENESWRETIEQRLLPFNWVGDMLIFPQDPLGKNGPKLGEFLSHPKPNK